MEMFARPRPVGITAIITLIYLGIGFPGWDHTGAVSGAQAQQPAPIKASQEVAAAGMTLHSVNVELPNSDQTFPGGASAEAVNANCLTCHSAGMVLTQPPLTDAVWQKEVDKMRAVYKAPIDPAAVPAIVAYLVKNAGVK